MNTEVSSPPGTGIPAARALHVPLLGITFFLSGVSALLYQTCWQRLLFTSFGMDIESVTIIVSTFMLGLGLGALAGGAVADRVPARLILLFAVCEFGIGLFGLGSLELIRSAGEAFVAAPRPLVMAVNFALLLVPTALMGATLPILVTDAVRRRGGVGVSTGALYFVNTLGASTGALAIAMGAFAYMELPQVIHLAAGINFAVAVSGTLLGWWRR